MIEQNNVFSLSGGKDSTAMLLMAIERGIPIHSVVFFDTGWEFPGMYDHINLLEKRTGLKIWRLHSRLPFDYWMFHRPIIANMTALKKLSLPDLQKKFETMREYQTMPDIMPQSKVLLRRMLKGKVYRYGNSWPSPGRRWCTREKVNTLNYFMKPIPNPVSCIGYAADESHRIKDDSKYPGRYPLIEWGVTEADALQYCYDHEYRWGGLYEHFSRVSCYCCPLQRIGDLRTLRKHYPDLWTNTLEMDAARPEHNRGFKDYKTVHDFEKRFTEEDRQLKLPKAA